MPGDTENIISMENFEGMFESCSCPTGQGEMKMKFSSDETFAYAQRVWDWVNGADNHSFVMVAGPGDCGDNKHRIPFNISSISYDEAANVATLKANASDWKTLAHTYDLVVGHAPTAPSHGNSNEVAKRDFDKDFSIDFAHSFPFQASLTIGKITGAIACTNCSTTGSFATTFKVSTKFFIPTGASMTVQPRSVSAIGQVKLSGSGAITDSETRTLDIVKIPIDALEIPGVLDFGPFLTFSLGVQLNSVTIGASIQGGGKATISDNAVLNIDLLHPDKNDFSGWTPQVEALPVRVDASITGGVSLFTQAALELRADALGQGFKVGVNLRAPNLSAKLSAVASPQGACPAVPTGTPKHALGVSASLTIGAQFNVALSKEDGDTIGSLQLATLDFPLATQCFDFGPIVDQNGASNITTRAISRVVRGQIGH
jgi:hypothetical protein